MHIQYECAVKLICLQNSYHDPKKRRRLSGCEGAPVIVTQDFSSAPTVYSPPVRSYGEADLHILYQAASIIGCDVSEITALDSQRRQLLDRQPAKRLRVDTDMSPTAAEKSRSGFPPPGRQNRSPREGDDDVAFSLGIGRSRMASCLASFCSPCTTCEPPGLFNTLILYPDPANPPEGYPGIPSTAYNYQEKSPSYDHAITGLTSHSWGLSQTPTGGFAYDDSPHAQYMPDYPVLQPTQAQPSTRNEEMIYQTPQPDRKYSSQPDLQQAGNHVGEPHDYAYAQPAYVSPESDAHHYMMGSGVPQSEGDAALAHKSANLDIVSIQQRQQPAKRGPFKSNAERERTAETRKIGSCIRCRMQRIRVSFTRATHMAYYTDYPVRNRP